MASPTSSQRLSFTQLVLDMGLAKKKDLLRAKKLIKERKAEGKKVTVARACVELEILTERQAKKVQLELKRLKEGFASSEEFRGADDDVDAAAEARKKKALAKKKKALAAKKKAEKEKAEKEKAEKEKAEKEKAEAKAKKKAKKEPEPESEEEPESEAESEAPESEEEPESEAASEEAESEEEPESEAASEEAESEEEPESEVASEEAESEEESESEAVSESEEEPAPKKKLAKKAPAKKALAKKAQKAKLGKEIVLESQKKKKGTAKRPRPGRSEAPPQPRKPSKAPLIAVGVGVAALVAIMGVVAMTAGGDSAPSSDGGEVEIVQNPVDTDTVETPPEVDAPPPPPKAKPPKNAAKLDAIAKLEKLALQADDLAAEGKFSEAIETLEGFPQDLRKHKEWSEVGERDLQKYRSLLPFQDRFEAALSAAGGGNTDEIKTLFTEIRGEDFEHSGEAFVRSFERRAKEAIGEEKFDELMIELDDAMALDDADAADAFEEDDDQNIEMEGPKGIEITTKGTPERRKRFQDQIPTAQANLAQAKKTLADRIAAKAKQVKAEAKKVLKAAKSLSPTVEGWGKVKVVDYTENGFTIKGSKGKKTFGWGNCPPKLGHKLKKFAIDGKDAQAIFDLGIYALTRAEFDLAQRDFQEAVKLDSSLQSKVPNIDSFRHLVKSFRGKTSRGDEFQVRWEFNSDRPQEALDFEPVAQQMKVEVIAGQLKIFSPAGFFVVAANVRGGWEGHVALETTLASMNPPPAIIVSSKAGRALAQFGQKTEVFKDWGPMAKAVASSDVRAAQGNKVKVEVKRKSGDKGTLKVTVQGNQALEQEIDLEGEITLMLGARGNGEVRFDNIHVIGRLDPKWERRAKAEGPNEISRQLAELKRRQQVQAGGVKMPVAYMKTSAEDEVGLADATADQKRLIQEGRAAMEAGNFWVGLKKFEESAKDYRFAVGNYLYALGLARSDPQGAAIRLKRAVKGVEDFYEAQVALATAEFRIGRQEVAEELLNKALALRPDYAPAYQTLSQIQTIRGEYQEAKKTLQLAEVLGPGDPTTTQLMNRVIALAEGPAWADRKRATTTHYVLDTDMVDYADQFVTQLESIRLVYEEAYPALINPDAPKRQASVLIFGAAEGYYQYSERTSGDRAENTLGHFSPSTGQLLLFLEEDPDDWNSYHVIFHEGMHQWCHSNGLALPFWANEGMAEYVGGTRLSDDGTEVLEKGAIDTFLKQRLRSLIGGWKDRLTWRDIMSQSPQEFYAGNAPMKYAQAWTIIHFIMESGDEKLKETFDAYLRRFKEIDKDDQDQARGGAMLEYIYVDTFHQLDMQDVTKRWEQWVQTMCEKAGLRWTLPE